MGKTVCTPPCTPRTHVCRATEYFAVCICEWGAAIPPPTPLSLRLPTPSRRSTGHCKSNHVNISPSKRLSRLFRSSRVPNQNCIMFFRARLGRHSANIRTPAGMFYRQREHYYISYRIHIFYSLLPRRNPLEGTS